METFDFSEALKRLKIGHGLARQSWGVKAGMEVRLHSLSLNATQNVEVFVLHVASPTGGLKRLYSWTFSASDLLAKDWVIRE